MMKAILYFLATNMDLMNFRLFVSTPANLIPSRLPQIDESRSRSNPALASMVFGSMPASLDMSPSSSQAEMPTSRSTLRDTIASNILLNVDFENLNTFSNYIQAPTIRDPTTTRLLLELVSEREARRLKAFTSRVSNKERMADPHAWDVVGLKETISDGNVLSRDRVGFMLHQ
jgi:hypothetical protein